MAGMHIGGFATCLCADVDANGALRIANAGHLAPYNNSRQTTEELLISNGLPLGILAETEYTEDCLHLAPGDTLTFISDGVVEARGPSGDFFGFDRARDLSGQPAREIAAAAQAFGQQDDITVVTLTFAGVASLG
jgi:serine phosphatase RsbU (regulator of sigma subunit)